MRRIDGIAEVLDEFDTFVVDQFGVLHDGRSAYSGARAGLEALHEAGKRIVLVSNSGKRSAVNEARIERLGFPRALYDAFVTSGETAHGLLREGTHAVRAGAPTIVLSRGCTDAVIDGLDLVPTLDASEAELVLIAGSEADRIEMEAYETLLRPAALRGVPALCTNPDRHMLTERGIRPGPGAIAERYEAMGGTLTWIGKPHRAIYEHAARMLGGIDWSCTLGIGDSAEHDIAGIRGMGAKGLLVETGVAGETEIDALRGRERPDMVMAAFRA